jgi:hypothetical protein
MAVSLLDINTKTSPLPPAAVVQHTDHKPRKERIDPAHDQRLRNHHHHVPLHHSHHALHSRRIRHWVRSRLALVCWVLQELSLLEAGHDILPAFLKGWFEQLVAIDAEIGSSLHGPLLAECGCWKRLWNGGEEGGRVVAEDTGQNLKALITVQAQKIESYTMTIVMGKRIQ